MMTTNQEFEELESVKDERTRYGRTKKRNAPKNTLFTYTRNNEDIFFGISRCNSKADRFIKRVGRHIAEVRAMKAEWDDNHNNYKLLNTLSLHGSGLRGKVKKSNVKDLLNYFKTIDKQFVAKTNK